MLSRTGRCARQWPPAWSAVNLFVALAVLLAPVLPAADSPTWEQLQAEYAYDPELPLEATADPVQNSDAFTVQRVTFRSTNAETVPALLCKPSNAREPLPCLLFLHGYGGSKEMTRLMALFFCPQGYALLGLDAEWHGERKQAGRELFSADLEATAYAIRQTVVDLRRAVDYLLTRPDIDPNRLGYLGTSMGAILGAIACGLDDRLKASVLIVGGGDFAALARYSEHPAARAIGEGLTKSPELAARVALFDPVNFVAHIAPRPLLMVNGTNDQIVPRRCAQALYDAAGEPKQIIWFEANHTLDTKQIEAVSRVAAWLKDNL